MSQESVKFIKKSIEDGDVIPVRSETDFRVAMKHIGHGEVIKFLLAPKSGDIFGMLIISIL